MNFQALYRTVEVDGDGDFFDWGVVTGKDEAEAKQYLRDRFDKIGLTGIERKVNLYVITNPGVPGVVETQNKRVVTV